MKITVAQLNPTIGDIRGNLKKIVDVVKENDGKTDLIIFPELFLTGYPPRDILENSGFIDGVYCAIEKIKKISEKYKDTGLLIGLPSRNEDLACDKLFNSAFLFLNGNIAFKWNKTLLPVYDVFDETRYFNPAKDNKVFGFKDEVLGVSICEDMWCNQKSCSQNMYDINPIKNLSEQGATIILNLSASPFSSGKAFLRYQIIKEHVKKYALQFIFVNQIGGNDELVFDGGSIYMGSDAKTSDIFPSFVEHMKTFDTKIDLPNKEYYPSDDVIDIYEALILGVRDYTRKTGFTKAVVGLSGGIDSAVTCAIATRALGSENVIGVYMPSPYSLDISAEYSKKLARNLGVEFKTISISNIYKVYLDTLGDDFKKSFSNEVSVSMQNIQARIRGNILMFFSNEYGYLLLSTGNKSELATGYCTLYGDMAGGLAVISDVPKTMVYKLAGHINSDKMYIPQEIIDRVPTAELKPNQRDQDTLPPYDVLDSILFYYMEEKMTSQRIKSLGFLPETVDWVLKRVNGNEYKRRQAPTGLKVTGKAFGIGRRMPIAAKFDI